MAEYLLAVGIGLLLTVAAGLVRILRGPARADRMIAAQLLGTGGIAVLLVMGAALDVRAAVDVALVLALLAAFASVAFVKGASQAGTGDPEAMDLPPEEKLEEQ